jgi:dihydroxyacetone synthase
MAPIAIAPEVKEPVAFASTIKSLQNEDRDTIDLVLRQFRCLIADLCQQFNGGHPG